jgi:hypothetical protein
MFYQHGQGTLFKVAHFLVRNIEKLFLWFIQKFQEHLHLVPRGDRSCLVRVHAKDIFKPSTFHVAIAVNLVKFGKVYFLFRIDLQTKRIVIPWHTWSIASSVMSVISNALASFTRYTFFHCNVYHRQVTSFCHHIYSCWYQCLGNFFLPWYLIDQ